MVTAPDRGVVERLESIFDKKVARALCEWAKGQSREVDVPSRRWRRSGHTGAVLATVLLRKTHQAARDPSEKIIVKMCPDGSHARETGRHEEAWDHSEAFSAAHLVRQLYPRCPVGDGRFLMFQEIVGSLLKSRTFSELSPDQLARALGEATRLVLAEWNSGGPQVRTVDAAAYLRAELPDDVFTDDGTAHQWVADAGLLAPEAEWITTREDAHRGPLPNPVRMAARGSVLETVAVDYLAGASHGDLHLDNLLVPMDSKKSPRLQEIRLIDLSGFLPDAPLSRDPVMLMLSALLKAVPELPENQAEALLDYVLAPEAEFPDTFPSNLAKAVWAVCEQGERFAHRWSDEWRAQYLLSLHAQALLYISFDNAGPVGQWWFFRLAARAGDVFLSELEDAPVRGSALYVESPRPRSSPTEGTAVREAPATSSVPAGPVNMTPQPAETLIDRSEPTGNLLDVLRVLHAGGPENVSGAVVAVEGPGGNGKTILAQQIGRSPEVRTLFRGGVLWVDIGEGTSGAALAAKVNDLSEMVSGHRPTYSVPEVAGTHLGRLIGDSDVLLILDDVWSRSQLRPFLQGAPRCVRLVTTRNSGIVPETARSIVMTGMTRPEAISLLTSDVTGIPARSTGELMRLTRRWPLLLRLVNRTVRRQTRSGTSSADAADEVISRLNSGGLTSLDLTEDGERALAVRATLEASLVRLTEAVRARYTELSVFEADTDIPRSVLELYWGYVAGLTPAEVGRICEELADLSLLSLYPGPPLTVRLHDVVRSYLRESRGPVGLAESNTALLDAARSVLTAPPVSGGPAPWWSLPATQTYLWTHLSHHLREAGRRDEFESLASDLRFVTAKMRLLGPVAVEADLALATGPVARELLAGVQRTAHLLEPTDPADSVNDILLSRLGDSALLARDVERYRRTTPGLSLRTAWPLPDGAHPALRRVVRGHTAPVGGCALSGSEQFFATASDDATVRLWDTGTGQLRAVLEGHRGPVLSCAVSPDDNWVVSTGNDGTVRMWDTTSGEAIRTLRGHTGVVRRCAVGPDGTWLASCGDDGTVRVWDAASGDVVVVLMAHTGAVRACAVSADGEWLVSAGGDGAVRMWHTHTWEAGPVFDVRSGAVRGCAVNADGSMVASAGSDGSVRLWDTGPERRLTVLAGHRGSARSCAISVDGTWVAGMGSDGTIRLWDVATAELRTVLTGHKGPVRGGVPTKDGATLISVGEDGTVRGWDLDRAPGSPVVRERQPPVVRACAAAVDQDWLAAAGTDPVVRIWDVRTGRLLHGLEGHERTVRTCAFSPDGRLLASGGDDRTVRIWDLDASATLSAVLEGHSTAVRDCAFGPDGSWLLSAASDGSLRVWDTSTGELRQEFGHTGAGVWTCSVAPDGTWAATAGEDAVVRLWDLARGMLRAELRGHTATIWSCRISPDGRWIMTVANDHTMRMWDARTQVIHAVRRGHTAWINTCCVSPDGRWAASGGYDGTVRVWPVTGERPPVVLEGHAGVVWAVSGGAGGRWLASASEQEIRVWEPDTGRLMSVVDVDSVALRSCAAAPDGSWLLCAGGAGTLYRLDLDTGRRHTFSDKGAMSFTGCVVGPDGSWAVTVADDGGIRIWDTAEGHVRVLRVRHPGSVQSCALAPGGRDLVTAGGDGTVRVWDLEREECRTVFKGHTGWVRSCAIAPDGSWVAGAGDDGTMRVWTVDGGGPCRVLGPDTQSPEAMRTCAVSSDGSWLAGGGDDGVVHLWNIGGDAPPIAVTGHRAPVLDCAFSGDDRFLATVSADRSLRIWDRARGAWAATMRVEAPLRGVGWFPDDRTLWLAGEAGVYLFRVVDHGALVEVRPTGPQEGPAPLDASDDGERLATVTVLRPSHVTDAEPSAPATTPPAAGLTDLIDEALGRIDHWQDAPGALRRALRALLGPLTELARQDAALTQAVAEARATERSASQLLAILRATAVAAPAPGARAVDTRRTDALCEQVRATLTQLQNTLNRPPRSMF